MNVLFVNMPFGSLRPAIGVSLLKGHLARQTVTARVEYLNHRFAQLIGRELYEYIADAAPSWSLLGEWVFAPYVFDTKTRDADGYFAMLAACSQAGENAAERHSGVVGARDVAGTYLEECVGAVDWARYDVVGFTTTFTQNLASLALARRLRERFPRITLVFGGANCEGEMGLQLHRSFPFIDFVCSGEADLSFPELIQRLQTHGDLHSIPGVISRRGGASQYRALQPERVRDLDTLPLPDYDDYFNQDPHRAVQPSRLSVPMESSRGCWWGEKQHCTFCGLNGLSMAYRPKSPQRALEELIALTQRYGTPYISMVDNILDMRYLREMFPRLKERGLRLDLFYETKANLTKEQVRLLGESGVRNLQPGVESLSTNVLRLMRKGTTALQNVQLLKWCREVGIVCHWNILYGFPGEDPADYADMVTLMDALHHLDPPTSCGPIRLDRFSPHFTAPEEFGLCNVRPDRAYDHLYDLPGDEVRNIAYYFQYDHLDGRDVQSYAAAVHQAVSRWTDGAASGGLVYVDDGTTLTVQDYRVNAVQHRSHLAGPERTLYQYCDQNRSLPQILSLGRQLGRTEREVGSFLATMTEARLMAAADGRYLSLAIPAVRLASESSADDVSDAMSEEELAHLSGKLEAWMTQLPPAQQGLMADLLGPGISLSATRRP